MASKTIRWPHFMMLFPLRGTHLSEFVFRHPGHNWGSLGGKLTIFRPKTGSNKGQLTNLVEAICHQFRERDEEDLKKLNEWQRRVRVRACCSSVRPLLVRSPTNKRRPPNEGWTEKRLSPGESTYQKNALERACFSFFLKKTFRAFVLGKEIVFLHHRYDIFIIGLYL